MYSSLLRFKANILKSSTRTFPGAVLNSDHDLVFETENTIAKDGKK